MTDDRPIRVDAHDTPDEEAGPDTPKRFDDPGTTAARNLPPRDEPAEGRRDIPEDSTQPRDEP